MLDLHTANPELYIDDRRPQDLIAAAEQLATWDEAASASADCLLNAWTLRACMNEDPEGTADLAVAIRALRDRLANSRSLPDSYRHRWQGYLELLNSRTLRFTNAAEIELLLNRPHVVELLRTLPANGEFFPQWEVKAALATQEKRFSDSRLSQILGQIEDHGLIGHRKRGKYKDWRLTESGQQVLAKRFPAERARAPVRGFGMGDLRLYSTSPERLGQLASASTG